MSTLIRILISCLFTGLGGAEVMCLDARLSVQHPTTSELAAALGIKSFCGDLTFTTATHVKMVAEVENAKGETRTYEVPRLRPNDYFRARVFCFYDLKTSRPEQIVFNLTSSSDVAHSGDYHPSNAFIPFPPEVSWFQTISARIGDTVDPFDEKSVFLGFNGLNNANKRIFKVRFSFVTSETPFPLPSSDIRILDLRPDLKNAEPTRSATPPSSDH